MQARQEGRRRYDSNFDVEDPEHQPDPESLEMEGTIEKFKDDPQVQAIYSEYGEAIDEIFEKAKLRFADDVEEFDRFLKRFSVGLRTAEEQGQEIIDVIELFKTQVQST